MRCNFTSLLLVTCLSATACQANWLERFKQKQPEVSRAGIAVASAAGLPTFRAVPEATGLQVVRVSLPFAPGSLPTELGVAVLVDETEIVPAMRVLTEHPGLPASVRRAILTFEHEFKTAEAVEFHLRKRAKSHSQIRYQASKGTFTGSIGDKEFTVDGETVSLFQNGKSIWQAELIAPLVEEECEIATEIIEQSDHFLWVRVLVADAKWPRIVELKADSLGTVGVRGHLQQGNPQGRKLPEKLFAPDLGWRVSGIDVAAICSDNGTPTTHSFVDGEEAWVEGERFAVRFPNAHLKRRGEVVVDAGSTVTYFRCHAEEKVPQQEAAWRSAAFTIGPKEAPRWTTTLEPPLVMVVDAEYWKEIYRDVNTTDSSSWGFLQQSLAVHQGAMESTSLRGDDYGNVSSMPTSGVFGMNRLNHCPSLFHEYYHSGRMGIRETAVSWCSNFYDLSIWWGDRRAGELGGTRYNNRAASGEDFVRDPHFMWRGNRGVHFCTKGYDSFYYAYEETGDPRMAVALHWQLDYAKRMIHTDEGECRNIGDVLDFLRLYEFTGIEQHLLQALRLYRELCSKLSPEYLFDQSGKPIVPDVHFIDDDQMGKKYPYAKPYIIGYALAGLPRLAEHVDADAKLTAVIRAISLFLAETQDPVGGWRYPHPRSTRTLVGQGMEHSAQLARAAEYLYRQGETIESHLNAIECCLQARIGSQRRAGTWISNLIGWEASTGYLKEGATIYDLYEKPEDRDTARDYTEGDVATGSISVEGCVYFSEVLDFYLRHRPAERLLNTTPELEIVLQRIENNDSVNKLDSQANYLGYGVEHDLPVFNAKRLARMQYPLAWNPQGKETYNQWQERARTKLLKTLLAAPPRVEFDARVIARESRDGYEARKLVVHISADNVVPAYLLVPEGEGPFPAAVALHDHGAHFSIGKEKVVRPFGVSNEVRQDAEEWTASYYGGRYIGDELARQGFVVLAIDALFWGERGRKEGIDFEAQQKLSANLLQLGMTWSGVITWDDLRSAEFLASQPEVDPARIAAIGLSMGSHRAWMLAAASDRIAAGASICWMCDSQTLAQPDNNQTKGSSSYSMIVPNLRNYLDYPDVASIACPKPMLFYNGSRDKLFPVEGVKASYKKMQVVWDSQDAGNRLETKIWPVPHEFNTEMQDEAFAWLKSALSP